MSLFCLLLLIALSDSVKRVGDTKTPTALYRHHNKSRGWLCEPFPVTDNNETINGKEIVFIKGKV